MEKANYTETDVNSKENQLRLVSRLSIVRNTICNQIDNCIYESLKRGITEERLDNLQEMLNGYLVKQCRFLKREMFSDQSQPKKS